MVINQGQHAAGTVRSHVSRAPERRTPPVFLWAMLGAALLAVEAYVLIRWVTGPYFERVPSGPDTPPVWMQVALVTIQVVAPLLFIFVAYQFVGRPYRRDHTISTDGMFVIALLPLFWMDPLSAYGENWFTFNAWMINFGSWTTSVPGWQAYGQPGEMIVEPLLWAPMIYPVAFLLMARTGAWAMRMAKTRWPRMSNLELIGVCLLTMVAIDAILEGALIAPFGIYELQGVPGPALFADSYHKVPLMGITCSGAVFAACACLRYFVDDRGRTLVERGSDQIKGSNRKRLSIRILALAGAFQIAYLLTYNVPMYWAGTHSTEWPTDLQKRSYLTNGLCGDGTNRACPGPAVPHIRNGNYDRDSGSVYVTPDGGLFTPKATKVPPVVPFYR